MSKANLTKQGAVRVLVLLILVLVWTASTALAAPLTIAQIDTAKARTRTTLESQNWVIELIPKEGQKGLTGFNDVLTFTAETMASQNLTAKGYNPSNYSLTSVESNGMVVWETMQAGKTLDTVLWRGELRGRSMNGVMIIKNKKSGTRITYYFTAVSPVAPAPAAKKTVETKKGE